MDNYIQKFQRNNNNKLSFDDWVHLNFNILNDIIYKITNILTNDSKNYKFVIDEISLSNEILLYLYKTSYSKFKNELIIMRDY